METTKSESKGGTEEEFIWDEYLELTKSLAVPHTLFSHVEQSLQSGFKEGMKLEVPYKNVDDEVYWVATITMVCEQLLRMRYVGEDDRSQDFWCDLRNMAVHPVGWCVENEKPLRPPDHLAERLRNQPLAILLNGTTTVSAQLVASEGYTAVDRIKQGMKLEVQDEKNPYHLWVATVIENVGGRLLLRYDTPDSNSPDFWLFYSSPRLFPMGWASRQGGPWKMRIPSVIGPGHGSDEEWQAILEMAKQEADRLPLPADIFSSCKQMSCCNECTTCGEGGPLDHRAKSPHHQLHIGDKMEAVHPGNMAQLCPASVVDVYDSAYFLVSIDGVTSSSQLTWLATISHPYIFPVGWARENNVKLTHPQGWTSQAEDFCWNEYLHATNSDAAKFSTISHSGTDVGFVPNMKLEAVNPENQHQICAATIEKITNHLIWIHLDSTDRFQPSHVRSMYSLNIFPVGWCESNSFSLQPPLLSKEKDSTTKSSEEMKEKCLPPAVVRVEPTTSAVLNGSAVEAKQSFWCPKIYFNHRCFSGPWLSKGRLAQLPKAVGPGPVTLVMKEVLSMLISVAYTSSKVLKQLQWTGRPQAGMHLEVLKAKHKNNTYRASVAVVTSADRVEGFCQEVCRKLQVCPYLFGPTPVNEKNCPESCHATKSRFLTGSSTASSPLMQIVRKAKKRHVMDESLVTAVTNNRLHSWPLQPKKEEKGDDNSSEPKEKRIRYETRGVKLPNFGKSPPRGKNPSSASETSSVASVTVASSEQCSVISKKDASAASSQRHSGSKRGRRTKAEAERLRYMAELNSLCEMDESEYRVETNPLLWTCEDLYQYIKKTKDVGVLANILKEEEFDGKSFMLLNLPSCLENLHLNHKTALMLCKHVEAVKYAFFCKFVTTAK